MKIDERPSKWPKKLAPLTLEQQRIADDFMNQWLTALPQRYGVIENFNHGYPVSRTKFTPGLRTLEVGAGRGEHIIRENLDGQHYVALEMRANLCDALSERFPDIDVVRANVQEPLPFPDDHFDRIIAVHVLEHLPDLPRALDGLQRVLKPKGQFLAVIPCEGGLAYSLARNISAKPMFEKRYKQPYDWFIKSEHVNVASEVIAELKSRFTITHSEHFPLRVPVTTVNLVIGLDMKPIK